MIIGFYNDFGQIQNVLTCSSIDELAGFDLDRAVQLPDLDGSKYFVSNGQLFEIPSKPDNHIWDWGSHSYVLDPAIRDQLIASVTSLRVSKSFESIAVDGIVFDGDLTAQTNLKSKIEEVRARIETNVPMPFELLIWRDADNVNHMFPDMQSYLAFMQRYAIALSERGTRLYVAYWAHKELIRGSELVDLLSYDVNTLWPD